MYHTVRQNNHAHRRDGHMQFGTSRPCRHAQSGMFTDAEQQQGLGALARRSTAQQQQIVTDSSTSIEDSTNGQITTHEDSSQESLPPL